MSRSLRRISPCLHPLMCALLLSAGLALAACSGSGPLNGDSLQATLDSGTPGQAVTLQGGGYTGVFEVPSGLTIDGAGSVLAGTSEGAVLTLEVRTGDTTVLRNLTLKGVAGGLVVSGRGTLRLENVTVSTERGVALAVENVALVARDLNVSGVVEGPDDPVLDTLGETMDGSVVSVMGLVTAHSILDVEDVTITGFAGMGAVFYNSEGVWNRGSVTGCVGTAVLVEKSDLELNEVVVKDGLNGRKVGFNTLNSGVIVTDGAFLSTGDLEVSNIKDLGVVIDSAYSEHTDVTIADTGWAGVWLQNSPDSITGRAALRVLGDGSSISRVGGSGVYMRDSGTIEVENMRIERTRMRPGTAINGLSMQYFGDGMSISSMSKQISLSDVFITGSDRIGLFLDGSGRQPEASFTGVVIEVGEAEEDERMGFVAQNGAEDGDYGRIAVDPTLEVVDEPIAVEDMFPITEEVDDVATVGLIGTNGLVTGDSPVVGDTGMRGLIGTNGLMLR